jgi:ADP-ribosylation factor related protein 1
MYHLLKGLHEYLTRFETRPTPLSASILILRIHRKDEFSVIIIGLDGAGKTVRDSTGPNSSHFFPGFTQTLLEKIKTIYNDTPGLSPDKIAPTVGQNSTHFPPFTRSLSLTTSLLLSTQPGR